MFHPIPTQQDFKDMRANIEEPVEVSHGEPPHINSLISFMCFGTSNAEHVKDEHIDVNGIDAKEQLNIESSEYHNSVKLKYMQWQTFINVKKGHEVIITQKEQQCYHLEAVITVFIHIKKLKPMAFSVFCRSVWYSAKVRFHVTIISDEKVCGLFLP